MLNKKEKLECFIMPNFENCEKDIDFINAYLKVANEEQLKIIRINIARIFIYGA